VYYWGETAPARCLKTLGRGWSRCGGAEVGPKNFPVFDFRKTTAHAVTTLICA
jgi:hypothetical protein